MKPDLAKIARRAQEKADMGAIDHETLRDVKDLVEALRAAWQRERALRDDIDDAIANRFGPGV